MAFTLNRQILLGNLAKDATHEKLSNGNIATNFRVVTTLSYKDKDGNWQEKSTGHNVSAYNLSEFHKNALVKGAKVYLEGRTQVRTYEDNGVTKYITEVRTSPSEIIPLGHSGSSKPDTTSEPEQIPAVSNDNNGGFDPDEFITKTGI